MHAVRLALAAAFAQTAPRHRRGAGADDGGTIIIHSTSKVRVYLEVYEGTVGCDTDGSTVRYHGPIEPNQLACIGIEGESACVRSTTVEAPETEWEDPVVISRSRPPARSVGRTRPAFTPAPYPAVRYELSPR